MEDKEKVLQNLGKGWYSLIENIYSIQQQLPFCSGVDSVKRKNGMLSVVFLRSDSTSDIEEFILDSLEYKIERISAKLCEECGKYGLRRKELPIPQTLCTSCYAFKFSDLNPVPSLVANPEPQID